VPALTLYIRFGGAVWAAGFLFILVIYSQISPLAQVSATSTKENNGKQ
jgi:hypothetical protein